MREEIRLRLARIVAVAALLLCEPLVAAADSPTPVTRIQPPPLSIGVVTFPNGRAMSLSGGMGGGAYRDPLAPKEDLSFLVISDRGPSIDCAGSMAVLELDVATMCGGNSDGRIHPLPDYNPVISVLTFVDGKAKAGRVVPITDRAGRPVTGLPNPLAAATTARAFGAEGQVLGLNPAGLDPQALVALPDGRFLIGDAYAPSLVLVSKDGAVERRIVPQGLAQDVRGADYAISEGLPGFLLKRPFGGGFAGLSLAGDRSTAIAALSGWRIPAGNGLAAPILLFDLAQEAARDGVLYPLDDPSGDILELVGLGGDRHLVVERTGAGLNIVLVHVAGSSPADRLPGELANWPVLAKTSLLRLSGSDWSGQHFGAAALLPGNKLLLISDGGYGLTGKKKSMFLLDLSASLGR